MGDYDGSDPRSRRDKIIDRLLLLYLYQKVSRNSWISGDVKLQKLVFLSEKEMQSNSIDGYNYKFFRWNFGPMSKGVYEDHDFLQQNGLVSERGQINNNGEKVLDEVGDLLNDNPEIVSHIDDVVNIYGDTPGTQLKEIVYQENIELPNGRTRRIRNIPEGTDVMLKLNPDEASETFELDEGWEETLEILLDKQLKKEVEEARRLAREEGSELLAEPHDV